MYQQILKLKKDLHLQIMNDNKYEFNKFLDCLSKSSSTEL